VLTTLGSTGPIREQVGRVVASRAMASRASGAIAPDAQQQGELPMSPDRAKTADQGVPNRVNSRTPSQTARAIHRLQKGRARNHSCTSCGDAGSLVDRAAWNSNRRRGVGDTRGKLQRALSWLNCWRRLQVRWDRDSGRWFALVLLACVVVCCNRLQPPREDPMSSPTAPGQRLHVSARLP
jgi:hypothetical protein